MSVEHRCCVRHFYVNWRKKYVRNELLQIQFWTCVKSTNMPDFEVNMIELKKLSIIGFENIFHTDPKYWCKAYFINKMKCDIFDNNLFETFNGKIIKVRIKI